MNTPNKIATNNVRQDLLRNLRAYVAFRLPEHAQQELIEACVVVVKQRLEVARTIFPNNNDSPFIEMAIFNSVIGWFHDFVGNNWDGWEGDAARHFKNMLDVEDVRSQLYASISILAGKLDIFTEELDGILDALEYGDTIPDADNFFAQIEDIRSHPDYSKTPQQDEIILAVVQAIQILISEARESKILGHALSSERQSREIIVSSARITGALLLLAAGITLGARFIGSKSKSRSNGGIHHVESPYRVAVVTKAGQRFEAAHRLPITFVLDPVNENLDHVLLRLTFNGRTIPMNFRTESIYGGKVNYNYATGDGLYMPSDMASAHVGRSVKIMRSEKVELHTDGSKSCKISIFIITDKHPFWGSDHYASLDYSPVRSKFYAVWVPAMLVIKGENAELLAEISSSVNYFEGQEGGRESAMRFYEQFVENAVRVNVETQK